MTRISALVALLGVTSRHSAAAQSFSGSDEGTGVDVPPIDSGSDFGDFSLGEEPTEEPASDRLRWTECDVATSGFECATLTVPLCHDKSCGSTGKISLGVSRFEAASSADAPTIWMVLDDYVKLQMLHVAEHAKANVYALDHRFRVLSDNYNNDGEVCGSLVATYGSRPLVEASFLTAAEDCSKWLQGSFGKNGAAALSLDNTAKDLHLALTAVQQQVIKDTKIKTFVYASKTGTQIVQRLIALGIKDTAYEITGYVYENPVLMKLPADYDKLSGEAMDQFLASCDRDDTCKAKFDVLGISMAKVLDELYAAIDATATDTLSKCASLMKDWAYNKERDLKPSDGVSRLIAWMVSYDATSARVLAPILYRVKRCSEIDAAMLNYVRVSIDSSSRDGSHLFEFMRRVVLVSELWPSPTPSQAQLIQAFDSTRIGEGRLLQLLPTYCLFTAIDSSVCTSMYKRGVEPNASVTLVYAKPTNLNGRVDAKTGVIGADADVLILTSRLQLTASVQAAEQMYDAYMSSSSSGRTAILVASDRIPAGSEFESDSGTSNRGVFDRFIQGKATQLKGKWFISDLATTLDSAPAEPTYASASVFVNFTTEYTSQYFGVAKDPWEGQIGKTPFVYSYDDDSDSGLWWLLLGPVIVVGIVCCACNGCNQWTQQSHAQHEVGAIVRQDRDIDSLSVVPYAQVVYEHDDFHVGIEPTMNATMPQPRAPPLNSTYHQRASV